MSTALALLLCASLSAADSAPPAPAPAGAAPAVPAPPTTPAAPADDPAAADNLDFSHGLAGWEGTGFYLTTGIGRGPSLELGVCSSDRDKKGNKGTLHRTFVVPPEGGVLHCRAVARIDKDFLLEENDLDVVLLAAGKRVIPKRVRTTSSWQTVGRLQRPDKGQPREYVWHLDNYRGQTLRIAIVDQDPRPGCHVWCGGFRLIPSDVFEPRDFARFMKKLTYDYKLPRPVRFDSEHFTALSTADDDFIIKRLNNCELMYDMFYHHFPKKGFVLHKPATKLMVAIFDSQTGFDAYVGERVPFVGLYHRITNRLVVYDLGLNRDFLAMKHRAEDQARGVPTDMERVRSIETVHRWAKEFRTDQNIATIMHEVAHQLSFNSGMLDRDADIPMWLAEGMACYCEATEHGAWQGMGESDPDQLRTLVAAQGRRIPLREMLSSDEWRMRDLGTLALGYAQSWALFKLLMEEQPHHLAAYCALVSSRRAGGLRFNDFAKIFEDYPRLELRYEQYLQEQVEQFRRPTPPKR
jgi:hypothetical protein